MSGIEVLSRTQRIIVLPNTSVSIVKAGPSGPPGVQGVQGPPGSDSDVTESSVEAVIGPRNGVDGYLGLDILGLVPEIRIPASIARDTEAQNKADTAQALAQAYADVAISALVDSSPGALDTLNELAAALGNDPNFATTINNALAVRLTETQGDARYAREQIDIYAPGASYTWVKPVWAKTVQVILIGGGAGGGSGRRGAAATIRCGGGGASGAGKSELTFVASDLPQTINVTVGLGGNGGAAVITDDTNGNNGSAGGQTYIGATLATAILTTTGGNGGSGGTNATGPGGAAGLGTFIGGVGASGSITGLVGSAGGASTAGGPGGASGGGITTADVVSAGGAGGLTYARYYAPIVMGGASGVAGASSPAVETKGNPGQGAAGGGSSKISKAGGGGSGAAGSGGGGGGASLNGFNSGAGGSGGSGIAILISRG